MLVAHCFVYLLCWFQLVRFSYKSSLRYSRVRVDQHVLKLLRHSRRSGLTILIGLGSPCVSVLTFRVPWHTASVRTVDGCWFYRFISLWSRVRLHIAVCRSPSDLGLNMYVLNLFLQCLLLGSTDPLDETV
jgi:hypothetical protein